LHNYSFVIRLARRIIGTDVGEQDLDLNEPYFLLFGRRVESGAAGQLSAHAFGAGNPFVSGEQINPAVGELPVSKE
jgi:hypothetical protein